MIHIVQVYPYQNNGCSVRIGKGYDHTQLLLPEECEVFVDRSGILEKLLLEGPAIPPFCLFAILFLISLVLHLLMHTFY